MSLAKFGRVSEYVFDGGTGWTSPEYSGGGTSTIGGYGGGIVIIDETPQPITQAETGGVRPIPVRMYNPIQEAVAKPITLTPNTFDLNTITNFAKANPLIALVVAAGIGYLIFK